MRPTFLAFQTASRALAASKAHIDITGNNIANVNTEGYTRQRVDLSSISSSSYTQRYAVPGATMGYGVEVSGITQTRDPFLDSRFRTQNAEAAQYDTILSGLNDLEGIFDEIENTGLQSEMSNFINQLQILSQSPTSADFALVARTAAQKVTQILNIYSHQTEQVREQQIFDLENVVIDNDFNTTVKGIASLNQQIREEVTHGNVPNELYDKRNSLIDKLSALAPIRVTTQPEKISEGLTIENLNISLVDPTSGTAIGLVQNGLYNTLTTTEKDGELRVQINQSFGDAPKDITSYITSGTIKGHLDLINGKGAYAEGAENTFRGTLYYKSAMDTFAGNFAQLMNNLNKVDPTNPADPEKPLFGTNDSTLVITAGNIRISEGWMNDPSYITTTRVTSPSGGADNILRMIAALNGKMDFHMDPADPGSPVLFTGTTGEYLSGLSGELALDVELNTNFSDTANNVLYTLSTSRDAISGVSLDEEGINLMAYQKSYNAAARYFTVLDEAVDKIINGMGIVGR
jgi:flagellar hook-associated protein 1 FlgK